MLEEEWQVDKRACTYRKTMQGLEVIMEARTGLGLGNPEEGRCITEAQEHFSRRKLAALHRKAGHSSRVIGPSIDP